MRTIPPAETFIINKLDEMQPNENRPPTPKQVEEWMIEFAKMHVTEALKQASEKVTMKLRYDVHELNMNDDWMEVNKNSILTAYALDDVE
ncbi:hypothetical protein [Flavobacterium sp.]|uniref:hypothetical protein n=1 Tax=Flavobacterium sp. TaxID=239 RepID=UPI0038FCBC3B